MSITFSGLASGLDTDSIVTQLMALEREPITRLENDIKFYNTRLAAFSDFESKLKGLQTAVEDLDTAKELRSYSATAASEEFFSISASSSATPGSYDIEVVSLARVQKDVSVGYASSSTSSFSAGTITINGTGIAVEDGDSLGTIVDKINAANSGETAIGVNASLIYDGTATGYRIVLSGEDADTTITASVAGVAADGTTLAFSNTQTAQQAHIQVDGIDIYSNNNTISNAMTGITLTLLKNHPVDESTRVGVDVDTDAVKQKIEAIATAYTGLVNFIAEQKDSSWANDSGMQSTRRRLQSLLGATVAGTGNFQSLVNIGFTTSKDDGTVTFDSTKLSDAIAGDLESVEKLFLGEDGVEGMADKLKNFLEGLTDSATGIYAGKKTSTDSAVRSLNEQIERMELRLEKREATMRAQFSALELLMSQMNSTSSYLSQQISAQNSSNNNR